MMDKNEIIERLEEIAKHAVHTIGEEPFIMSLDDGIAVHEAIEIIQQSQPERTGHWIDKTDPEWDGEWGDWKCSCCGVVLSSMAINLNGTYLYCPKCGADMRGEQDERYLR